MNISKETMAVLADVLNERMKQVANGYTSDHDDRYAEAELAESGAAMALQAADKLNSELHGYALEGRAEMDWPELLGDMPEKPVREALICAVALLVAEVERIDRLAADGEIVFCACGHLTDAQEAVDCVDAMLCPECAQKEESLREPHESDLISGFLQARCEFNADAEETAEDFYAAFSSWLASEQNAGRLKGRFMSVMVFGKCLDVWQGLILRIQKEGAVVYRGVEIMEEFRAAGGAS